jgi:hypothetical protein
VQLRPTQGPIRRGNDMGLSGPAPEVVACTENKHGVGLTSNTVVYDRCGSRLAASSNMVSDRQGTGCNLEQLTAGKPRKQSKLRLGDDRFMPALYLACDWTEFSRPRRSITFGACGLPSIANDTALWSRQFTAKLILTVSLGRGLERSRRRAQS